MRIKDKIRIGDAIGRWSVIGECKIIQQERKWLCRCACGTERYVTERSLLYGRSQSCGCSLLDRTREEADPSLEGRVIGDLTVLRPAANEGKLRVRWQCRCACGNIVIVPQKKLLGGMVSHCGCKDALPYRDISGLTFGKLTALYPLDECSDRRSKLWHCRCACGNELDLTYNNLFYGNSRSCGCRKKENDQNLQRHLTRVDGTCINQIRSKRIPENNSSGVRGVFVKGPGRYVVRIALKKKNYYIGTYPTLEEAAEVRKRAEAVFHDEVADFYERWAARAAIDPEWAENNPIRIWVQKASDGDFRVHVLPELELQIAGASE